MELVRISEPPSPDKCLIRMRAADNVAVARVRLSPGQLARLPGVELTVQEPIAAGHKLALCKVPAGELVYRYGEPIGRATQDILPGRHVHLHNVAYEELGTDYRFPETGVGPVTPKADVPCFLGYPREDGRAGTRNYIAVVAASNCAAHVVQLIANSYQGEELPPGVDGVAAFPHGDGCSQSTGADTEQLQRTIRGVLDHPNVGAAIILGLGCEGNQVEYYLAGAGPRLRGMTIQDCGGTTATVEAGRREIGLMIDRLAAEPRVQVPVTRLVLGLECGGSDAFSGITSNPALGLCCDHLVAAGGTVILGETPEVFGAEHLLVRRARNRQVAERFLAFVEEYKNYLRSYGGSFNDNPSPGNKEGGLTNILEKSLGAVTKAGSSTLIDAVAYAERVRERGLVFMNTPGYDPASLTGIAAGGANIMAFTTGRGSVTGFPTVPVIKITSNSSTYARMRDNMDVNAGLIADGTASLEEVGLEIFKLLVRVASGERTCAERHGHAEFVPWRIGPLL